MLSLTIPTFCAIQNDFCRDQFQCLLYLCPNLAKTMLSLGTFLCALGYSALSRSISHDTSAP